MNKIEMENKTREFRLDILEMIRNYLKIMSAEQAFFTLYGKFLGYNLNTTDDGMYFDFEYDRIISTIFLTNNVIRVCGTCTMDECPEYEFYQNKEYLQDFDWETPIEDIIEIEYNIPVTWEMSGFITIKAESIDEALTYAQDILPDMEYNLPEGELVEHSLIITPHKNLSDFGIYQD